MTQKVMICCPIGGFKQYSILDWLEWIANQTYDNFEIVVCVNGSASDKLEELLNQVEINYQSTIKKITVLKLPNSNDLSVIQKITYSREMLRRYAVTNYFDYIFFLDSDTIPAHLSAISILKEHNKDVISGLYFYKNSKQPVIIDKDTHTNISLDACKFAVGNFKILEVWGFGFGCLLLSAKAFSTCEFDYDLFGEERTDDFGYCHVLEQAGFKRWFDPFVICKHLEDPNSKPHDIGTRIPFLIKDK